MDFSESEVKALLDMYRRGTLPHRGEVLLKVRMTEKRYLRWRDVADDPEIVAMLPRRQDFYYHANKIADGEGWKIARVRGFGRVYFIDGFNPKTLIKEKEQIKAIFCEPDEVERFFEAVSKSTEAGLEFNAWVRDNRQELANRDWDPFFDECKVHLATDAGQAFEIVKEWRNGKQVPTRRFRRRREPPAALPRSV
jgi:hypothetical protein